MIHTVKGCNDCLFVHRSNGEGPYCSHPTPIKERYTYLDTDNKYNYVTPSWCPLKKESIEIKLIEDGKEVKDI